MAQKLLTSEWIGSLFGLPDDQIVDDALGTPTRSYAEIFFEAFNSVGKEPPDFVFGQDLRGLKRIHQSGK
jgi:hypothetical protein